MLFPTVTFAVFITIVLPLSWLMMRDQPRWRGFILVASYVFYGWWDWRFCFLLAGSTIGNQLIALAIHRERRQRARKAWLLLGVAGNLAVLGYFKYAGFLVSSAENLLQRLGVEGATSVVSVALPIGISFYTFMGISYIVDTYRGEVVPASFSRFAVYLSFFPHLVAGPIVRASELMPQLERPRDPRRIDLGRVFFLILSGLFLKVVIANHLASRIVDDVFAAPTTHSSLEVLIGVYGYAVQIFADFCGYTNIAIGVALLLGYEFPQNFNSPYAAVSLQDFWRRWHMTLSRWLRDYLYIPFGGSRGGSLFTYRNLMLTFLLGGLWHGAAWTFVAWGGIHGAWLSIERFVLGRRRDRRSTALTRWAGRLITFHIVCLAWIFFRSSSFSRAGEMIERLFTAWGETSPLVTSSVVLAIAVGIAVQYVPFTLFSALLDRFRRAPLVAQAATLAIGLMLIDALGPQGVAPFIYFRF